METLNNKKLTPMIIECIKWIKEESMKERRKKTEEEEIWIDNQVKFRFGRAYDKIINCKWEEIYPHVTKTQNINRWLTPLDNTYDKVFLAYNNWAEYRHGENAGQVQIFNTLSPDKPDNILLPIIMVDTMGPSSCPYWAYNRKYNSNDHIIFPLCSHRIEYSKALNDPVSWNNKSHKLIFRGVTTSPLVSIITNGITKSSRVEIVSKWYKKSWADLGFNKIIDSTKNHPKWSEYQTLVNSMLKTHLSMFDMMKSKFILCIEGQDVSTSFGWVLTSLCAPIHPYPFVFEVWYFNDLTPWVHFIPCKPDGSDIEELMNWAQYHDEECRIIAENGRKHMEKMLDPFLYIEVLRRMYSLWDMKHKSLN